MVMNDNFFPELIDFAQLLVNQKNPNILKVNPLLKCIGFLESVKYLQAFHQLGDPNIYVDFMKRKNIKANYKHIATRYLEDYKAKNR